MSWLEKLYETYENNIVHIGNRNDVIPLLPICHSSQNAQVTVTINVSGAFLRGTVVPKSEARTIIPVTEKSGGRTSGYIPHPLCDKLQYVAADYAKYGGTKPSGFNDYLNILEQWCASPYSHPKVRAVHAYVRNKHVIQDLVRAGIFYLDNDGLLIEKWTGKLKETPEILTVTPSGQTEVFIRFSVEIPGDAQSALWTDRTVWESWERFCTSQESQKGLCFITGKMDHLASQHPSKIRNSGDKAKLISSNDMTGFTFRGRFINADEACGVSSEVTQKAHSALRWLVGRQGKRDGDQAIVAWAVSGADIPIGYFSDTKSLLSQDQNNLEQIPTDDTAQGIGKQLAKLIAGYTAKLGPTEQVVVMSLDSASPGRLAIRFYRELTGSEFLERLMVWHTGCAWQQRLGKDRVFVGAPAPRDIAETAYGEHVDKNLRKTTIERILPCIVDNAIVPRDLVDGCVRQACNRMGLEHWEWEKALGVACALYKYQYKERSYTMPLDTESISRDYLYGRLLALAEHLEGRALNIAGETRETGAARLMQRFADRPYSTWRTIETSLTPYKTRLRAKRPGFLINISREIDTVVSSFKHDDYISDLRLTGEFLLGYHCQRDALWSHPSDESNTNELTIKTEE